MGTDSTSAMEALPPMSLPNGVDDDYVDCRASCGLNWHILKAGKAGMPLVLFCHGYPELAYSWRKVLPQIADAGYYCVAMDQRGYGRTTGWPRRGFHEVDLNDYVFTNLVRDLVCLVYKLGYTEVHSIVGHDFGAVSSAMAALMRPDIFKSTVQLSHPHHAPPTPQLGDESAKQKVDISAELAGLSPPRKHYKWYNSTPEAAPDWDNPPQGLEAFLRGYFHLKSADWDKNDPHPLEKWSAKNLEIMPEYYIMRKDQSMPETVAHNMEGEDFSKTEKWLSGEELGVYCDEWKRTGFQGALNWYRAQTASTAQSARDMLLYAGRRIEVPCVFISGKKDWGNYQQPGAFEGYEDPKTVKEGCFRGAKLIEGAGHWVQQEQSDAVVAEILGFFKTL
ncbi:Uu.00g108330.m01.CDS01 [Anthostomella pinea]|uniref:Uu.00g108330.m01.CDS01 n=1 Tax=Anthostomella pinea TaxID=933095 RepID=A0AAI8VEZ9_9PEZI|nr:Uu.00g108330.m01.CDS01 [Anthostomella pinea]